MKICLILLMIVLTGCTAHPRKSEPQPVRSYRVEQRMSPAMKAVVMELVYMKSDPNIWQRREIDPFRRQ